MRMLFFVRHYFDSWGGIEEHVSNLANEFSKSHDVSITTPMLDKSNTKYNGNISYLKHENICVKDYDCIFIENFELYPHPRLCLKIILNKLFNKKRVKIYLVPHGGLTLDWSLFSFAAKLIKKTYNSTFGLWFINNFCDKCFAVSDWEKRGLVRQGIKIDIVVVRNGFQVLKNVEQIGEIPKENILIFVGRIDPIKNLEAAIQLFAKIVSVPKFSDYKFNLVGDYSRQVPYYTKLQTLINSLGLSGKVVFTGPKYGENKYRAIRAAQALVCMSHIENDPVVIKEAFTVGTKVLASQNGGLVDFKDENNIYFSETFTWTTFEQFLQQDFVKSFKIPILSWAEVAKEYEKYI